MTSTPQKKEITSLWNMMGETLKSVEGLTSQWVSQKLSLQVKFQNVFLMKH